MGSHLLFVSLLQKAQPTEVEKVPNYDRDRAYEWDSKKAQDWNGHWGLQRD